MSRLQVEVAKAQAGTDSANQRAASAEQRLPQRSRSSSTLSPPRTAKALSPSHKVIRAPRLDLLAPPTLPRQSGARHRYDDRAWVHAHAHIDLEGIVDRVLAS